MRLDSSMPAQMALALGKVHYLNVYTFTGGTTTPGAIAYLTRRQAQINASTGMRHVTLAYRLRVTPKVRP